MKRLGDLLRFDALLHPPQGRGVVRRGIEMAAAASSSIWSRTKSCWYAGALTVACALFTLSYWIDGKEAAKLQGHVQEVSEGGGGLIVVSFAMECDQTMRAVVDVARRVQHGGVSVLGLVVTDGPAPVPGLTHTPPSQMPAIVLRGADEVFSDIPHTTIRWRTVSSVAEVTGTPAVIGVDGAGRIRFVDYVPHYLWEDRDAEARRLLARLGRATPVPGESSS